MLKIKIDVKIRLAVHFDKMIHHKYSLSNFYFKKNTVTKVFMIWKQCQ